MNKKKKLVKEIHDNYTITLSFGMVTSDIRRVIPIYQTKKYLKSELTKKQLARLLEDGRLTIIDTSTRMYNTYALRLHKSFEKATKHVIKQK